MDIYQILVTHNREWTAREFLFFVIVFIVVAFCLRQLVKRDKMKGFQAYACLAALTFLAIVYAMHRQYLQEIHRQIIIITLIYSGPGGQYFVAAERC